jgi:hypothetical protein
MVFVLASGCYHATQLAATWHEPNATVINFRKPVAVFVTTDDGLRRSVEDQLVQEFPNATPSYSVIPAAANVDKTTILQTMRDAGFDGAIVMRVVDVTTTYAYTPGVYWGDQYGFAGYWGSSWAYPYNPYYVGPQRIVTVETQLYNLTSDKLIFAARSETTNPANAGKLIRSVMRHVNKQLRRDGMLASVMQPSDDVASVLAGR